MGSTPITSSRIPMILAHGASPDLLTMKAISKCVKERELDVDGKAHAGASSVAFRMVTNAFTTLKSGLV